MTGERQPLEVVRVKVAPLTGEAFRPFGELLAPGDREPDFVGISSAGWRSSFAAGSEPEVMFYRSRYAGLRFRVLERHHHVTQTFIPLGRVPAVVAVAPPTGDDELPDSSDVCAFILDGTAGYVLHAGTWHSPDRYPLYPPHADVAIITDRLTQHELESSPRGPWKRTEAVDYADRLGIEFELEL
jgi:ureidoglycolate lyase